MIDQTRPEQYEAAVLSALRESATPLNYSQVWSAINKSRPELRSLIAIRRATLRLIDLGLACRTARDDRNRCRFSACNYAAKELP